jgi:lipoprotein NlpI
MRLRAWVFGVAVVSLGASLAGCSGSEHGSLHKPGVYTGAKDPLIEKEASAAQQEKLLSRFNQIQTDR